MTTEDDDLELDDEPEWIDRTLPMDGKTAKTVTPRDVLLAAARMQRDGMSLRRIRYELQLIPDISDNVLQRAINRGHKMLARAIARGVEPAESRIPVKQYEDDVPAELWLPGRDFPPGKVNIH